MESENLQIERKSKNPFYDCKLDQNYLFVLTIQYLPIVLGYDTIFTYRTWVRYSTYLGTIQYLPIVLRYETIPTYSALVLYKGTIQYLPIILGYDTIPTYCA